MTTRPATIDRTAGEPRPAAGGRRRGRALKLVRGTEARYLNPDEPIPAEAGVDLCRPPRGLGAGAARVWRRLAPDLVDKGCLTAWDVDLFGAFCVSVAQYSEARQLVAKHGATGVGSQDQPVVSPYLRVQAMALEAMLKLSARFGLSPADRAGLVVAPPGVPMTGLGPERLLT